MPKIIYAESVISSHAADVWASKENARAAPKLVGALLVDAVDPLLVEEDEEHDVVAED